MAHVNKAGHSADPSTDKAETSGSLGFVKPASPGYPHTCLCPPHTCTHIPHRHPYTHKNMHVNVHKNKSPRKLLRFSQVLDTFSTSLSKTLLWQWGKNQDWVNPQFCIPKTEGTGLTAILLVLQVKLGLTAVKAWKSLHMISVNHPLSNMNF